MKKVSLKKIESLEKSGWQIKKEDRDRIAAQKTAMNMETAARSISDSIQALALATKDFKPTKDGAVENTLKEQVELMVELVKNIGLLAEKPKEKPEPAKSWVFDIERKAVVEFTDGTEAKGFISRVVAKQTGGKK